MKELIIALWFVAPMAVVFFILWALHDPTVKKQWGRMLATSYVLALMIAMYAVASPDIQKKVEEYFAPEPVAEYSPRGVPPAMRSQTVPRGAYNQWLGRNPSNIYTSHRR